MGLMGALQQHVGTIIRSGEDKQQGWSDTEIYDEAFARWQRSGGDSGGFMGKALREDEKVGFVRQMRLQVGASNRAE